MFTRRIFLTLGIVAALAGNTLVMAQKSAPKTPAKSAQPAAQKPAPKQDDEGPVVVTEATARPAPVPVEIKAPRTNEMGNFGPPVLNNKGDLAFISRFWSDKTPGNLSAAYLVKKADGSWKSVTQGEKGTNFDAPLIALQSFNMNDNGELTFIGAIDQKPNELRVSGNEHVVSENMKMQGVFTKTSDGIKLIAGVGQEIPNNPALYLSFANASMNSKGTIAYIGTYTDPDGRGLFIVEDGKTKIVARSGQRTPAGVETSYSEHFYPTAINERGEIAFFCHIGNGGGVFVRRATGMEAIALQDKPTPIAGANFIGFGNRIPAISNSGDVAFTGFFDGDKGGRGLFYHSGGKTVVVARSGDKLPDSEAMFTDFNMPSVNSKGEIAFIGNFAGRARGVFLKTDKGIEAVALYEKAVPGLPRDEKNVFNNFVNPVINENGDIAFLAQIKGAGSAIFYKKKGEELKIVAQAGDLLPIK